MDPQTVRTVLFVYVFACGVLVGVLLCTVARGISERRKSRESWRVIHRKGGF